MKAPVEFEDLGKLPNGWAWQPLQNLTAEPRQHVVDGPFGSNLKASEYVAQGVPIARLQNIDRNEFIHKNIRFITAEKAQQLARHEFKAGDILVTKLGDPLGKACIVPLGIGTGVIVADLVRVRADEQKIDRQYLTYAINSPAVIRQLERHTKGTTRPRVNLRILRELPIPVAPRDQQMTIAAEIDKHFSRLDEAVESLKRVKAKLRSYGAAVLKAAVEGCLVPTEAAIARRQGRSYESGVQFMERILEARRRQWQGKGKYKEPVAPDISNLQDLPSGWAWATVDQLAAPDANSITDGPFGSYLKTEHYRSNGPRVIRLQNIKDGRFSDERAHISPEHFEMLRKHAVLAGDLVIATLGDNPPRACIVPHSVGPAIVKADCIRFKPNTELSNEYLNAALNSDPTRKRVKALLHGMGRPRLSLGEIRAIALPVPPIAEQRRIVIEIDRYLSIGAEVEAQVDSDRQRAIRFRQTTLQQFFSFGLPPNPALRQTAEDK